MSLFGFCCSENMPKLTVAKAKKILRDGKVHGKKLTKKQKAYFGLIAGGGTPTRGKSKKKRGRK